MPPNTNQNNEKYLQKLAVLQTFILDIVEAETFEEVAKHVFDAIDATIDPVSKDVGQVRAGAIRGLGQNKKEAELSFIGRDADGMPLDGPGIMVRAVNTRKVCNVPDTRKDSSYVDSLSEHYGTLSEIAVPILVQGKSIGVINIEEIETNAFDESDQKIIEALSGYAGVALSNILYSNRLNGLHKHTSQLSTLTSIGEVAEHTLDAMTETLELETCAFLMSQEGVFQTIFEKGLEESIRLREKGLEWFKQGRAFERWREAENIEFLSELETEINVDDEAVAILSAKSIQPDKYTEQDKKLLEILASHVASAIQRIRLLEEQLQYEAKLEALHLHTTKLADAENIEEISEYTIDAMETTLGFTWAAIAIIENNILSAKIWSRSGVRTYGDKHPVHIEGPGIGTRAARTGETQLVNDVRKDVDYIGPNMNESTLSKLDKNHQKDILRALVSLSEIDVPVKIGQTVVAILNAESIELNAFTEHDKNLLEILASHVASAIQRIRLLEAQIQYEAKLEERAKKLEALNIDLEKEILTRKEYEKEIIRVARESEVDKLRSQFLSTITHELRTPLTSIKGYTETIRAGWDGEVTPEMHETLNIILRNTDRLSTLTNDLLDVQRIASGRLEVDLENIVLNEVIEQSVNEINPVLAEKSQVLQLEIPDEPLQVVGDSQRLNQVLVNLLNNASKFSDEETTIHLRVETDDDNILVSVIDSGMGIKRADIERVFTPLAMIEKPVYVKGTGLGLSISKGIIDRHNGTIWAESEGEWKGSTFSIQLPKGGES